MTTLTCPKCRHGLSDDALDAGACPLCGFPLDGPVVLTPASGTGGTRLLIAAGVVAVLAGAGVAGYTFFGRAGADRPAAEVAALAAAEVPAVPVAHVAPFPHEPKRPEPDPATQVTPGVGDKGPPLAPEAVVEPPRVGPRPVGVVMKVDPKIAPVRHFDSPDDIAALPDLNTGDRVTLTGRVRVLRLGSVHGKGFLDASALVAEEVVITGDLNNEARVTVNAPRGKVTVGGYVAGTSKLTVAAPGGEVVVASSGRVAGGATVTVVAKRLEVNCPLSGGAKVNVTLSAGGSLKLKLTEEGATVTYRKAAPADPPPAIEKGEVRGGARVVAGN